jgi:DNA modification methylase
MQNQTTLPATPVHGIVTMPFAPYYDEDGVTIYNADCKKVLPFLEVVDLVLTDPPYGLKRFNNGQPTRVARMGSGKDGLIEWDQKPTDYLLSETIAAGKNAIVWGANNYGLPPSEYFLVWDKEQTVDNFASAELAYTNIKCPAKVFRYSIHKHNQIDKVHPTQKPLALMRWCLSLVPEAQTVLDPFMGSGTTLVAARLEGRKAIGIEISERYCEAAVKRLAQKTLF